MLNSLISLLNKNRLDRGLGHYYFSLEPYDINELQNLINTILDNTAEFIITLKNLSENKILIKEINIKFINDYNIQLKTIFNNLISEKSQQLSELHSALEISKENIIEIEKQIKNNDKKNRENNHEIMKQQTDMQNLSGIITKEIEATKEVIKIESENHIKSIVEKISSYAFEMKNEMNKVYTLQLEEHSSRLNDLSNIITNTKQNHTSFINLVEKAGIYELTQNYSKKADEEKQEYKDYRKYTTWAILAAIAATLVIFALPIIESWIIKQVVHMDYFTLFARLTISIMFFALAFYTSKQAGKHYECYQENHRTYLQLAALEPFISRMNDDDKLAIRKELISVYFNKTDDGKFAAKGDEVDLPSNWTSIVHKLIDTVKDNKQAAKNEEN